MKSLSFVSTQMQLINCIEYITENGIEENEIVFFAASQNRIRQILNVYNLSCNKCIFQSSHSFVFNGRYVYDVIVSLFLLMRVWWWTKTKKIDVCILGNYKICYGRFFWYKKSKVKRVVVDDGLGTPIWYKIRYQRGYKGISDLFYNNRFVRWLLKSREDKMFPDSVLFYSIYLNPLNKKDIAVLNRYNYLKKHHSQYPNSEIFRDANAVFLGQPFHTKNIVTYKRYNEYLRKASKLLGNHVIYYPHPEETSNEWMEDDIKQIYQYVPNTLSFEIYALGMKAGGIVASFQTSAQPILQKMCPDIRLMAVYVNEIDNIHTPYYEEMVDTYKYMEKIGIQVIRFSE